MQKLEKNIYYFKDEPKEQKKIEILVWCPTSPGGQIIPRWHGRPPPTFQCGTDLFTPHSHRRRCHPSTLSPSPRPLYLAPLASPTLSPPARSPPSYASCRRRHLRSPVSGERIEGPFSYAPLMLLFLVAAEDV